MPTRNAPLRFCILTTHRSGSTWLMDLLASHPRIRAYGEIFVQRQWHLLQQHPEWYDLYAHIQPPIYFYEYQEQSSRRRPWITFDYLDLVCGPSPDYDVVGFKLMYIQLKRLFELAWKLKRDRYRIVHLVRNNYLDIVISNEMRKVRDLAHANHEVPPAKVYLEPKALLYELYRAKRRRRRGDWVLALTGMEKLEITYDELCNTPETAMARICAFLSVPPAELRSDFRKLNRQPHWESIANYEEVRRALKGSEYEPLLQVPS
ncbi:MAG: sulfotransferase domain-containing protein [Chloroflexi bacterium]|nr:sulfotransferase domain-containing protein [Chloroflexota bacterium]